MTIECSYSNVYIFISVTLSLNYSFKVQTISPTPHLQDLCHNFSMNMYSVFMQPSQLSFSQWFSKLYAIERCTLCNIKKQTLTTFTSVLQGQPQLQIKDGIVQNLTKKKTWGTRLACRITVDRNIKSKGFQLDTSYHLPD